MESLSTKRQRDWLAAIRRKDIKEDNYKHTWVCSDHFISGKPSPLYNSANPDWIPSLNLGYTDGTTGPDEVGYKRAQERAAKCRRVNEDDGSCFDEENETDGCCVVTVAEKEKLVQTQTDLRQFDMTHFEMELKSFEELTRCHDIDF